MRTVHLVRIESDGVRAYDMAAEKEIFLPADTAIRAGKIHAAIYTAYCAAREL